MAQKTGFSSLTKTPEQRKFYQGRKWTNTSKRHRRNNPLCETCEDKGLIRKAQLVHHDPDFNYLTQNGLNPYDEKYLHSSCDDCHLEELRKKRTLYNRQGKKYVPETNINKLLSRSSLNLTA